MSENTSLRERLLKAANESWARADAQCEPGEVLWKAPLVDLLREAAAALSTPPAEGMCKMVRVQTTPGGRHGPEPTWHEVPAVAVGEFFAVHADLMHVEGRTELGDPVFNVTHLPSGLKVATSPSQETAVKAAKAMAELPLDWSSMRRDDVATLAPELRAQIDWIRAAASADGDIFTNAEMDDAAMIAATEGE